MDWITHAGTGFFFGQLALKPEERPQRAGWWWVLASISPDWLEFLTRWFGDIHRGVTHSLYMWPLLALGWAAVAKRWGGAAATPFKKLWSVFFIVIGSHLLLDVLMSYRLYLAWPFAETRWAWGIMPLYDIYIYGAWLLLLGMHHWRKLASVQTAKVGLAIFMIAVSIRAAGKIRAHALADNLMTDGTRIVDVRTRPTYYEPWIWFARASEATPDWTPINVITGQIIPFDQTIEPWFPPIPGRSHVRRPRGSGG
ncbi:MAG TPA: metal-dependent hydrolase [candidate division Zixibacteria bacterium]|jgi:membrane-bound metal-dependent hydrolase YbcI (DUF457 family)